MKYFHKQDMFADIDLLGENSGSDSGSSNINNNNYNNNKMVQFSSRISQLFNANPFATVFDVWKSEIFASEQQRHGSHLNQNNNTGSALNNLTANSISNLFVPSTFNVIYN
jgi:hypothetical protein